MDFICSIELFRASSAPGGRVARVPVVWDSSLHPHTRQTEASAVERIRPPLRHDVALERIWHLSCFRRPALKTHRRGDSLETHDRHMRPHRARIDGPMPTTDRAGIESNGDRSLAECSRVAARRSSFRAPVSWTLNKSGRAKHPFRNRGSGPLEVGAGEAEAFNAQSTTRRRSPTRNDAELPRRRAGDCRAPARRSARRRDGYARGPWAAAPA